MTAERFIIVDFPVITCFAIGWIFDRVLMTVGLSLVDDRPIMTRSLVRLIFERGLVTVGLSFV